MKGQCPVVNFIVWKRFIAGIFEKLSGFPYYYKNSRKTEKHEMSL